MQFTEKQKLRFWEKVDKNGRGGCWVWTAGKFVSGYGKNTLRSKGVVKQWLAHRLSYLLETGKLPQGNLVLDHLCENRACVNPSHLDVKTIYQNASRSKAYQEAHKALPRTKGGVSFSRYHNRWVATRREWGKPVTLGSFHTRKEAETALRKT